MRKTFLKLTLATLSAGTLLLAGSSAVSYAQEGADEVVATIGEKEITKEELYQAMKNISGDVTLRTIILESVLEQNVKDTEALKTAAEEEVKTQIDEAGGEEVFQQLLAYQNLGSIDEYKYQIYVRNLFQEVVGDRIDISDENITQYYENTYTPLMQAQHILVETEEEALAVIERINNGEEFDAVAQEVSLDSTAQNGGLLEPFSSGTMVPEFEEAVKSLANGEITEKPVKSNYGYHVIRTIENGEKKPLEEVRAEVEQQYVNSKFADTNFAYGIVGQLIIDAGYEIKDEDLQGAVQDLIDLANSNQAAESADTEGEGEANEETTEEVSEEVTEEESTEEAAE